MRTYKLFPVLACLCLLGCDDSNQAKSLCHRDCGHGSCFYQGTQESCLCDVGYVRDVNGYCGSCDDGYTCSGDLCLPESACTGQCLDGNQICAVVGGRPVCSCAPGFVPDTDGCKATEVCYTSFKYVNQSASGLHVYLAGTMNDWRLDANPLEETSSGVFEGSIYLDPGTYKYKFYVSEWGDGGWKTYGDENGDDIVINISSCSRRIAPKLVLDAQPAIKDGNVSFTVHMVDDHSVSQNVQFRVERHGSTVQAQTTADSVTVSDPVGEDRKISYTIWATSANGVEIEPLYVPVWNEATPFDWRSAVMYFAFTDRFNNGNTANDNKLDVQYDWMGGDFEGLRQKVEAGYFDDLGVNALWISSVSMNTQSVVGADGFSMSAYHSYWPLTTGYTEKTASMFSCASSNNVPITPIEPHFGTMEELQALVDACHARGIRVLVDFAVNHVNNESPVYSKHPKWFNLPMELCTGNNQDNWNRIPETCWFGDNLPDFNYNLPEVREFVINHARWLIRTTGIDGFRLDAVKHMPQQFISELRLNIDDMMAGSGQTFYIVGETFDGVDKIKQYIGSTMLHGQFDFPLYNMLRSTIMNGDGKFWDLKDFVLGNDSTYGSAIMSTFLGNHDVARAISHIHHDDEQKYGNNNEVTDAWAYRQLKLAWVFLFTSPMIPLIYYGDEIGLEGANDPDNRRMMKFGTQLNPQQKETLELVQKLGQIRRAHPVLYKGTRKTIDAYARSYVYLMQGEGETILIGISDSDDPQNYTVPEGTKGWINLLDESETISETTNISLTKERYIIVWKLKD